MRNLVSMIFYFVVILCMYCSKNSPVKSTESKGGWKAQNSGTLEFLYDIHCADENTCWIVGGKGTILHTSDGGNNWIPQDSKTSVILTSINFHDGKNGCAVGDSGLILHTTDGGKNWDTQNSGTHKYLSSIFFIDKNKSMRVRPYNLDFQGYGIYTLGDTPCNLLRFR